jgi:anti-sigma regulatory factor (Ser/Thr protein kinase)
MFVVPIYYKSPDFCATQPIGCELRLRATLVVEELFSNTVPRGHRGDSASPVRLALALGAQGIELFYEDQARAFDPLAWARAHPRAPEAKTADGRGVLVVQQLSIAASYAFEDS